MITLNPQQRERLERELRCYPSYMKIIWKYLLQHYSWDEEKQDLVVDQRLAVAFSELESGGERLAGTSRPRRYRAASTS